MAEKFGPYRPEPITKPEAPKLGDVGYIDNQIDEWIKKSKPEEKVKISTEQTALKTERDQDRKLLVQDVQAQSSGLSVEFTEQALAVTKEKMKEWKEKASSDPEAARNLLMAQVSDLDGKSGVEIRNNFHLFGKNDQKYGA